VYNLAGDMSYYYLDSDKNPQGPYSVDELNSFKVSGLITDETLAAAAGDSKWRALSEVLKNTVCSTWNNKMECPHCQENLENEKTLPNKCPHCLKWIHGNNLGLWGAFIYALKNFWNFKGRASRTEFWGFYLFSSIINLLINKVTEFMTFSETELLNAFFEDENSEASEALQAMAEYYSSSQVLIAIGINFITFLIFFIPFLAVSVRRMHDVGRTGKPVFIGFISVILMYASFGYVLCEEYLNSSEEFLELPYILMITNSFVFISISIYLFIMMILPGDKGTNQFGPSAYSK
jgi:uncharacterized membrane protein YhaH (DUF805 family)